LTNSGEFKILVVFMFLELFFAKQQSTQTAVEGSIEVDVYGEEIVFLHVHVVLLELETFLVHGTIQEAALHADGRVVVAVPVGFDSLEVHLQVGLAPQEFQRVGALNYHVGLVVELLRPDVERKQIRHATEFLDALFETQKFRRKMFFGFNQAVVGKQVLVDVGVHFDHHIWGRSLLDLDVLVVEGLFVVHPAVALDRG